MVRGLLASLTSWATESAGSKPSAITLFPKVDPKVDGDDCDQDCASCSISYPKGFNIEERKNLYGGVEPWEMHLVVATGKSDWVRNVANEKGSVMEAIGSVTGMKLSASNMPLPHHSTGYDDPTTVLLLPAMAMIENVTPGNVKSLLKGYIEPAVKNTTLLGEASGKHTTENNAKSNSKVTEKSAEQVDDMTISTTVRENGTPNTTKPAESTAAPLFTGIQETIQTPPSGLALNPRPCPHKALVFLCSQRTRDVRCGQSAPLIRRELERHLRPLNLYRDLDDERPGGVGIYFISHVGGHKWSANVLVYRCSDPWGVEDKGWGEGGIEDLIRKAVAEAGKKDGAEGPNNCDIDSVAAGAAQCIWLARVKPEDCEGIVKYTILQGKVVKPEQQLRGGFDRIRGLTSW